MYAWRGMKASNVVAVLTAFASRRKPMVAEVAIRKPVATVTASRTSGPGTDSRRGRAEER